MNERFEQKVDEIVEVLHRDRERKRYSEAIKVNGKEIRERALNAASQQAIAEYLQASLEQHLKRVELPNRIDLEYGLDHHKTLYGPFVAYDSEIDGIHGTFIDIFQGFAAHGLHLSSNPILVAGNGTELRFYERLDDKKVRWLGEICFNNAGGNTVTDLCSKRSTEYGLNAEQIVILLKTIGIPGVETDFALEDYRHYSKSSDDYFTVKDGVLSGKITNAQLPFQKRADELFHEAYVAQVKAQLAVMDGGSRNEYFTFFNENLAGQKNFRRDAILIVGYKEIQQKLANALGVIGRRKFSPPDKELPIDQIDQYEFPYFSTGIERFWYDIYPRVHDQDLKRERKLVRSGVECHLGYFGIEPSGQIKGSIVFKKSGSRNSRLGDASVGIAYSLQTGKIEQYDMSRAPYESGMRLFRADVEELISRINKDGE